MNDDDFSDMESRDGWQGLRGLKRVTVIDEIAELGLLDKIEDNTHMVPFGDRSDVVIEPWLLTNGM